MVTENFRARLFLGEARVVTTILKGGVETQSLKTTAIHASGYYGEYNEDLIFLGGFFRTDWERNNSKLNLSESYCTVNLLGVRISWQVLRSESLFQRLKR